MDERGVSDSERLPVTLLAGFLGAGKTTVLNRLLADPATGRAAVIVNEFGELGVDGRLVVGSRDELVELANGCLCCTLRGDLAETLDRLLARRRARWRPVAFERVLIEASGLAAPGPVAQTLFGIPELRAALELDGVVCVVHAALGRRQLAEHAEAREQAALADLFVINHRDHADAAETAALEAELAARQPFAERWVTERGDVPAARLLDLGAGRPGGWRFVPAPGGGGSPRHTADAGSVVLDADRPLDADALAMWLRFVVQRRGHELWRVKGLVACRAHDVAQVVQAVGPFVEIRAGDVPRPERSQLVLIGRGLDRDELERGWRSLQR